MSMDLLEAKQNCPILIEWDEISTMRAKILSQMESKRFLVVISERVEKVYGKALGFSKKEKIVIKDGEKNKNFKNYNKILNRAFKMKLTRNDVIVAIGGGVVGDMAGFVASTYMRGIDFIQVPTTLLACVDSSIGGKTGIDNKFGKNLVGAFYQPKAVLINTNFLKTLDMRQLKSGLGEVVKYAFIEKSCLCDEEYGLMNFLSENSEKILACDNLTMSNLIQICLKLKISVVEKDVKESDLRRVLNFGHTYAHAIEGYYKYKKYTHGEAVVEGIKYAFELAEKRDFIEKEYKFLAFDVLKKFDFTQVKTVAIEKIIKIMQLDKKATHKNIVFMLPVDYAKVEAIEINPSSLLCEQD